MLTTLHALQALAQFYAFADYGNRPEIGWQVVLCDRGHSNLITSHTLSCLFERMLNSHAKKFAVRAHSCKVLLKVVGLQDANEGEQILSAVLSSSGTVMHHSMEHVSFLART